MLVTKNFLDTYHVICKKKTASVEKDIIAFKEGTDFQNVAEEPCFVTQLLSINNLVYHFLKGKEFIVPTSKIERCKNT